jgi:hypothetical protein
VVTLDAAAEWKVRPWDLVGGYPLLWYLRFRVLRQERASVAAERQTELEMNALMRR